MLMIFNPPVLSYLECVEENHLVISLALMIHALAPKSLNTWGCFPRPPATVAFMKVCILGRDLRKSAVILVVEFTHPPSDDTT